MREPDGRPSSDLGLFREVLAGLSERCDAILQPTSGGGDAELVENAMALLPLLDRAPARAAQVRELLGLAGPRRYTARA